MSEGVARAIAPPPQLHLTWGRVRGGGILVSSLNFKEKH